MNSPSGDTDPELPAMKFSPGSRRMGDGTLQELVVMALAEANERDRGNRKLRRYLIDLARRLSPRKFCSLLRKIIDLEGEQLKRSKRSRT